MTFDEWKKSQPIKTLAESYVMAPLDYQKEAWHGRDEEVAVLQRQRDEAVSGMDNAQMQVTDLQRQLKENEDEFELKAIAAKGTDKLLSDQIEISKKYASEIVDLQRQLEPSPCGHRKADTALKEWKELSSDGTGMPVYECLACRREQEIRREERKPICELIELWRVKANHITFIDEESSLRWHKLWNSLVDRLTDSGDYRALPEREGGKDGEE